MTEAFTFKLSKPLGGRTEVLKTPAEELLQHLQYVMDEEEQKVEQEKARAFIQFLTTMYATPSMGQEDPRFKQERKEFLDTIRPKSQNNPPKKTNSNLIDGWDEDLIRRLAESQKGG